MLCITCNNYYLDKHFAVAPGDGTGEPMDVDIDYGNRLVSQNDNQGKVWTDQSSTAESKILSSEGSLKTTTKMRKCAIEGCTKEVYCDHRLPEELRCFQYCSPQCRNTDLIGIQEQLDGEITAMEVALQSQKTPLSEFVTSQNPSKKKNPSSTSSASSKGNGSAGAGYSKSSGMITCYCKRLLYMNFVAIE